MTTNIDPVPSPWFWNFLRIKNAIGSYRYKHPTLSEPLDKMLKEIEDALPELGNLKEMLSRPNIIEDLGGDPAKQVYGKL